MNAREINLTGLAGPTHHFGGLAQGNVAARQHAGKISNPKAAARQCLEMMKLLSDLGVTQVIVPPQLRPRLDILRQLGFSGSGEQVMRKAYKNAPELLFACYSSSSMWTANATTISPSADSADGKVHFTPANLASHLHRRIETEHTAAYLKTVFSNEKCFVHHAPLPGSRELSDEGAANHNRLCVDDRRAGLQLFVYGYHGLQADTHAPTRFSARQSLAASQAIARLHQLTPEKTLFAQQNPKAIDAGVFHNDVIAVTNGSVMLYHEHAFVDTETVIKDIRLHWGESPLYLVPVPQTELSLDEAVASYVFNSQLVTLPDNNMALIAPESCRGHTNAQRVIERIIAADNPITAAYYVDCSESLKNGGGPACLRLRVMLNDAELTAMHQGVRFTDALYIKCLDIIERLYRDRLSNEDLLDPALVTEAHTAHETLLAALGL